MVRTAIQLYTVRGLEERVPALLRRVGATAFDGVEFAGFEGTSAKSAADALAGAGLDAAGAHVGVKTLENEADEVASFYGAIDCDRLTVPYLSDAQFEDAPSVREAARRLERLADRFADRGFDLGYHNHDHEFVRLDDDGDGVGGRTAFDAFIDETRDFLSVELDVGWAVAAGRDPVELLERLEGRVPLVHLKDVDATAGRPVELGDGDVNLEACATAARDAGTEWLIYEHDDPDDPIASLERGAETLEALRGRL